MSLVTLAGLVLASLPSSTAGRSKQQDRRSANVFRYQISGSAQPGQFAEPSGVAVAREGLRYVVDRHDHTVRVHDRQGRLVRSWGGFGSADGQFAWPGDIEIGPNGQVYVLDSGNYRIQSFSREGQHLRSWGAKSRLEQPGKFGLVGDYYGTRGGPQDIAIGVDGSVYVADAGNERIQRFDASGRFISAWPTVTSGLDRVRIEGLVTLNGGDVFVLGEHNGGEAGSIYRRLVQRFDQAGTLLETWPEISIENPWQLGAGANGRLLLRNWNELQLRTPSGEILNRWALSRDYEHRVALEGKIQLDIDGSLLLTDPWRGRLVHLSPEGSFLDALGGGAPGPGQISYPWDIALSSRGEILVADIGNEQIQRFGAHGTFLGSWGDKGEVEGSFNEAYSLALDSKDHVYVADLYNHRVQVFDPEGTFIRAWTHEKEGMLHWYPRRVAVAADDTILVYSSDGVNRFTAMGQYLGPWEAAEDWLAELGVIPTGMRHATDVFALGSRCWGRYDLAGVRKVSWNAYRPGEPCLPGAQMQQRMQDVGHGRDAPESIPGGFYAAAPAPDGSVYVSTGYGISHFTETGERIDSWGDYGGRPSEFLMPNGLAVMPEGVSSDPLAKPGTLYVADAENSRIQVFGHDTPAWRSGFYDNPWLAGYPSYITETQDLDLDWDWGLGSPDPSLPTEDLSVRSERSFTLDSSHRLSLEANGGARLWLDDQLLVDEYDAESISLPSLAWLGPGEHQLVIYFRDAVGPASMRLRFEPSTVLIASDRAFLPLLSRTTLDAR